MSSSFITTAIAHDAVCPKGEEWMFHLPKVDSRNSNDATIAEEGEDYIMVDDNNEKVGLGLIVLAGLLTLGGIASLVAVLIKHI